MVCQVRQDAASNCWPALLAIRNHCKTSSAPGLWMGRSDGSWRWGSQAADLGPDGSRIYLRRTGGDPAPAEADFVFCLARIQGGADPLTRLSDAILPPDSEAVLRLYLPILLGTWQARLDGTSFTSAHIAQTLDGRIACHNGHSQWISNEANLQHAHRLRALHDAVLVGSGTVRHDDPQLTVRHVPGDDPQRVVLSGSAAVLDLLEQRKIFAHPGCTLVSSDRALAAVARNGVHRFTSFCGVEASEEGRLPVPAVLDALAARGLHSVFVEGGSATCSSFFAAGAIDIFHLHIAPMVLGSGIPSFRLPEVHHVRDGHHLRMEHFAMDGELLLACRAEVRS